jgi:lipoate-protein ligase A
MSDAWRFVDVGPVEAPVMFGRMPTMAGSVINGGPQILMTARWSRGHFQVGWFEDVDAVLDLGEARDAGVDVFRRPIMGGGAAFYDTDAVAMFSYFLSPVRWPDLDEALEHFRPAMRRALDDLGLADVAFEGSSDLRWQGRKLGALISQTALGVNVVGSFFNLKRPDLELYARVARVPEEKFKDKVIKDAVAYICTPADVRGTDLGYGEFRDAIVSASREVLGLDLETSALTEEEAAGAPGFADLVSSDDWVRRTSTSRFTETAPAGSRVGFANVKGKKLVRAGVALSEDGTILRALMAGDMHLSPPDVMERVAGVLAGANAADREDLVARVRSVLDADDVDQPDAAAGITAEDCADAVQLAAKNAGPSG